VSAPGWGARRITIEVQFESNSTAAIRIDQDGSAGPNNFTERKLELYVDSKRFGRLWAGQGDTASNGTSEVDLSGTSVVAYSGIADMAGGIAFSDNNVLGPRIGQVFSNFGLIVAAARRFGMSKATVSKQVSMLEARIGVRLLNRTTRTLSLTSAGSRFYAHCRHIVAELSAAEIEAKRLGREPYGGLRVTACASTGRRYVAPVIGEFLTRYQNIQVDLTLSGRDIGLVEGGFDVAVLMTCHVPGNLHSVTLAPCARVICAAPSYLELHGRPETLDDLPEHCCITCAETSDRDAWTLQGPDGLQNARVNGRLRTDSWEALCMAALSGYGLALIPLFLVEDDLEAGRMCRVLPEYLDLSHSVYVVCPGQAPVSPSVEAFVTFMKSCFGVSHDRTRGQAVFLPPRGRIRASHRKVAAHDGAILLNLL